MIRNVTQNLITKHVVAKPRSDVGVGHGRRNFIVWTIIY